MAKEMEPLRGKTFKKARNLQCREKSLRANMIGVHKVINFL